MSSTEISPLAPATSPSLPEIAGVRLATAQAGIRYKNRTDVLYVALAEGTQVAGVFTRSRCPSAPVDWCREALTAGEGARALVVNSGNANAFTGMKGRDAVALTAEIAAQAAACAPKAVMIASTGVIGEPLDARKFEGVLADCAARAEGGAEAWSQAAQAIMTTDTFPKLATRRVEIDGVSVTINGIAKGAGMIAPDMATMLAFAFTDAALPQDVLQALLSEGTKTSFNCVTVDGDTSTSDTLLLFATGAAGSAARRLPLRPGRSADRTRAARRPRRRGRQQTRDRRGRGRRERSIRPPHRHVDRQLSVGEDGGRGRGCQLGPCGDGGRQGR
jgi:glutamate N-acetyltransferase/amino-acid N-acetyltransferase